MSKQQSVLKYEDAALILIDYQKEMFDQVKSETPAELIDLNVRLLIKAAKAFGMPVVLSTVGVEMGVNGPTRDSILAELPDATVLVLQGFIFVVLLTSETLYGRFAIFRSTKERDRT